MLPQNLKLCLLSPRVEAVSCHANEAINRRARRKLCICFTISLILSRYNSIRKKKPVSGQNNIGYDKRVETSKTFVVLTEQKCRQCFIFYSRFHYSVHVYLHWSSESLFLFSFLCLHYFISLLFCTPSYSISLFFLDYSLSFCFLVFITSF